MNSFAPALRDALYQGFFTIRHCDVVHTDADGNRTAFTRELLERGHAAAALIHDPVQDTVLMVREFRVGNFGAGLDESLWCDVGPVAGMIEDGNTPYETALREITEEAGLDPYHFETVASMTVLPSPGGCSETVTLMLFQGDLKDVKAAEFGVAAENEFTMREIWPRSEAMGILGRRGAINGNLAMLLMMLERERSAGAFNRHIRKGA